LTLSSKVLARDVYLTFGDLEVKPSDNYFDLLPNEPRQITLKSSATQEQLRQALKVISLVDAFDGKTKTAQAGAQ
jgi:beta-mannosidase